MITVVTRACGYEHRLGMGSIYSCINCGSMITQSTRQEPPCPSCDWPIRSSECTTCHGKGYVQATPLARREERMRIVSWLRLEDNPLREQVGSHALYEIAQAIERERYRRR